jgi:hypothetical protein
MTSETCVCSRCGITRTVKLRRPDYLCLECKSAVHRNVKTSCERCGKPRRGRHKSLCANCERTQGHTIALNGGQWVREGLVWRWETDQTVACAPRPFTRPQPVDKWVA